jgi:hypothetical protein
MSILVVAIVPPHLTVLSMRMAVAFYVTGISTSEVHLESPPLLGTLTAPISLSAGMRSSRTADVCLPQIPYGACMHTDIEELVVFCSECGHSEFVHADRGLPCLFSDCDCSGFDVCVQI